tara:strand:- start:65 stop:1009 length:945 start_codon:yes stop_codon:yes gene_type:complete
MKTLKINSEFAHELILAIPYAYWLHQQNQLEKIITSKDMKPFYYFCKNVEEKFEFRTLNNIEAGLNDLPNNWPHHNALAVYGKNYGDLSLEEQNEVNGVLDYTQWIPPPYESYYSGLKIFDKPYVVINNNYNIEFGNPIDKSLRFFDIESLYEIFNYLTEKGYYVIYKRPNNTEFTLDQNEMGTLQGKFSLSANVDGIGIISDYDLCNYYDGKVINLNELKEKYLQYSYNEFQLRLFSEASGFVTINGGGGVLCGYFNTPVVMHVPHGKELRSGYLTNKNNYYNKLSDNKLHAVIDPNNKSNYQKVINKIKETF